MLESIFKLKENGTTVRTEILAGLATFLTMAYILIVNPSILADAGFPYEGVFIATILAAVVACLIMGLYANWPIGLAPGMGLNAFVAYTLVGFGGSGDISWQTALGAVFISGILFIVISLTPLRQWIINSIPRSMKFGIGAGIGLFLAIIGLEEMGIVVAHPATYVTLNAGNILSASVLLGCLAFALMAVFDKRGIRGGIIISIILVTVIGMIFGVEDIFTTAVVSQSVPGFVHVTEFPSQIFSVPSFADTIFMQLDISSALTIGMVSTVLTLLFVDFMDTAGTLTSVANLSGRVDQDGKVDGIEKAVLADSVATAVGALAGTTNTTSYIESGAGIKEGGRTGLTAVTVGVLFLLCIFLAPLAKSVPYYASAPALVFIATYFMRNIIDIDWDDVSEYAPAVLAAVVMPFTFSIANGIAIGFLAYLVIKVLSGKLSDLNSGTIFIGLISVPYFYSVTLF
tara:strand:+ start:96 stop:1469 length:1374 start_codon:yes stop_codon:yes gene_type:complete